MELSHDLAPGDAVRWRRGKGPDPYGGRTLTVEQVYPREMVADAKNPTQRGLAVPREMVAVSWGARPDEELYEETPGHSPETCEEHASRGKCDGTRHYRGPVGGGAEYRGRELASNLERAV